MPCRFEVEPLCPLPQNIRKKQQCYALQGPDGGTELQMIAALKGLSPEALPLLPALLDPPREAPQLQRPSSRQQAMGQQQASSHARGLASLPQQQRQRKQLAGNLSGAEEACGETQAQVQGQSSLPTQPEVDQTQPSGTSCSVSDEGTERCRRERHSEIVDNSGANSDGKEAVAAEGMETDSIIQRFGLNAEQAAALHAMEAWALPGASQVCMLGSLV